MKFSILSALLLITIVGMGIAIYQKQNEVIEKQNEIASLEDKVLAKDLSGGTFDVVDPDTIYIRQLQCDIPNTLRYRIHNPEGNKNYLHFGLYFGGSEPKSYMSTSGVSFLPGENIISIFSDEMHGEREIVAGCSGISQGQGGQVRNALSHFRILKDLDTDINGWFRREPNSFHGPLKALGVEETKTPFPIVHFPQGIEKKHTTVQQEPVGAAFWIGPPLLLKDPIDERFSEVETVTSASHTGDSESN